MTRIFLHYRESAIRISCSNLCSYEQLMCKINVLPYVHTYGKHSPTVKVANQLNQKTHIISKRKHAAIYKPPIQIAYTIVLEKNYWICKLVRQESRAPFRKISTVKGLPLDALLAHSD